MTRRPAEVVAAPITDRQRDILRLLAAGCTVVEITAHFDTNPSAMWRELADLRSNVGALTNASLVYLAAVDGVFGDVFGRPCDGCGRPA